MSRVLDMGRGSAEEREGEASWVNLNGHRQSGKIQTGEGEASWAHPGGIHGSCRMQEA